MSLFWEPEETETPEINDVVLGDKLVFKGLRYMPYHEYMDTHEYYCKESKKFIAGKVQSIALKENMIRIGVTWYPWKYVKEIVKD